MVERPNQSEGVGSKLTRPLHIQEARDRFKDDPIGLEAVERFKKNPAKCFQRHIREVRAEKENHLPVLSLDGAVVEIISNQEAAAFIKKYEWLRSMGAGTLVCVGGKINGELFGVECFGKAGLGPGLILKFPEKGVTEEQEKFWAKKTAYLMRGACAPWAPKKAASFLIRQACRLLYELRGWQIFYAYSDSDAGEVGIVYQCARWHYLGVGLGKGANAAHYDYRKDGRILTSYTINHRRKKLAKELEAPTTVGDFRPWLVANGWIKIVRLSRNKGKYVWFEGTAEEVAYLRSRCRYKFLSYPKRDPGTEVLLTSDGEL